MEIAMWTAAFAKVMEAAFGERLVFLGLQGSQARGEAGPDSDIDTVVILDRLTPEDLEIFWSAVAELPNREKLCGFLSGAAELAAWDRGELFQFVLDTVPIRGDLAVLTPALGTEDACRAVHSGGCAIYHACCHNLLYERSGELLAGLYKTAAFTLRAKAMVDAGMRCVKTADLFAFCTGADRVVLERWEAIRKGCVLGETELEAWGGELLTWAQGLIISYQSEQSCP